MSHPRPPLSLYIHIPWCIRKCPYCDFNSHTQNGSLPETAYIDALLNDAAQYQNIAEGRALKSIFIGGGTPSLLSPKAYERLLNQLSKLFDFGEQIEITLEANPGTVEQNRFASYRALGINRLSLGIQSFNDKQLKKLGRIHNSLNAKQAIEMSQKAGFDNFNLDIMHHLPDQTAEEAASDIETALSFTPPHLSWYQLTIEPNTVFYSRPPNPPHEQIDDTLDHIADNLLSRYKHYEISAYCLSGKACQHNLNYWQFGDYIGIGAGAHGKISIGSDIIRTQKKRLPQTYLNDQFAKEILISKEERLFEFMLNTTRLKQTIPLSLFTDRTQLSFDTLLPLLTKAKSQSLLTFDDTSFSVSPHGFRFLNDLQAVFLPN